MLTARLGKRLCATASLAAPHVAAAVRAARLPILHSRNFVIPSPSRCVRLSGGYVTLCASWSAVAPLWHRRRNTPVDDELSPGDVPRLVRGQEQNRMRDVPG